MKTSRQRLLEYVNSHNSATVIEISRALKMTPANARHHLNILLDSGQVEVIGQAQVGGKGRPANIYGPSIQKMGHNLDGLAGALLAEIQQQPKGQQKRSLKKLAAALARPAGNKNIRSANEHLTQRLLNAIRQLNHDHYQARWEAHQEAPRLILGHCPYHAIIDDHPELCQMDAYLLTNLLDKPVEHIGKLIQDRRGKRYCIFRIKL